VQSYDVQARTVQLFPNLDASPRLVQDEVWVWEKICQESRSHTCDHNQSLATTLLNNSVAPMDTQQPRRPIPNIRFRVLIIGRANAGKTSILQRVCDTTDSPVIYRGKEEVRGPLRGPTVL
jgi:hypothetical protein